MIRIVGLSATLPNYLDVADFLKVNRYAGLFYFDAGFRPVPLQQTFMAVKASNPMEQGNQMDDAAFDVVCEGHGWCRCVPVPVPVIGPCSSGSLTTRSLPGTCLRQLKGACVPLTTSPVLAQVLENVQRGQQVMVFVHARNATVRTAQRLRDLAVREQCLPLFQVADPTMAYKQATQRIDRSRNKQLRELFKDGFAMHHAGLLCRGPHCAPTSLWLYGPA